MVTNRSDEGGAPISPPMVCAYVLRVPDTDSCGVSPENIVNHYVVSVQTDLYVLWFSTTNLPSWIFSECKSPYAAYAP